MKNSEKEKYPNYPKENEPIQFVTKKGGKPIKFCSLSTRDLDIIHRVTVLGKFYSEVGKIYNLSRERVRQIIKNSEPNWKRPYKYPICTNCGKPRRKSEVQIRHPGFDKEIKLCSKCRSTLRQTLIELTCSCCAKKVSKDVSYLFHIRNHVNLTFDLKDRTGIYLCRPCFYKNSLSRSHRK